MEKYTFPFTNRAKCKRCGEEIIWGKSTKGEWIAFDPLPLVLHSESCNPFWRDRPKRECRVKLTPPSKQLKTYQIQKMWKAFRTGGKNG